MDYIPLQIPTIIPDIPTDFLLPHLYSLTSNYQHTINWLRDYGLLARAMQCKCGEEMYEGAYANSQDGYKWKCRACKSSCSIRFGSFFHPSKLSITSLLQFMYLWCEDIQSHAIMEKQLQWAPATVVDWKNFMRDICVEEIIQDAEPLGGPGIIVEIDESKFGKRKYNRGRLVVGHRVFGIVERDTGRMVMLCVPDRSAATLYPLSSITSYLAPLYTQMSGLHIISWLIHPSTHITL